MKLYSFKEKRPLLGTNILVFTGDGTMMGVCVFDLSALRHIKLESEGKYSDYLSQEFFSDDPEEDTELDLISAEYWCYPSNIKLPKNKVKS